MRNENCTHPKKNMNKEIVFFPTIREQFLSFKKVPILKRGAIEENHCSFSVVGLFVAFPWVITSTVFVGFLICVCIL